MYCSRLLSYSTLMIWQQNSSLCICSLGFLLLCFCRPHENIDRWRACLQDEQICRRHRFCRKNLTKYFRGSLCSLLLNSPVCKYLGLLCEFLRCLEFASLSGRHNAINLAVLFLCLEYPLFFYKGVWICPKLSRLPCRCKYDLWIVVLVFGFCWGLE